MKIVVRNPEFFFALFYILSFTVPLILIIAFSIKRKIPFRSVLLMLTTVSLLTILGSRLFMIPVNEWYRIFSAGSNLEYPNRSAIGGLLFGLAGLLFSQKFLGIENSVLTLYAWITPLGLGIQKIGCFLSGCCYGKPADLPWSVRYPTGTSAHFHQWVSGMIDKNSAFSTSVHPVQLYEMILFFIIAYTVWRTRNVWKKNGNTLLFSLFLFFIFRFSIEFLRDPAASSFGGRIFLGVRLFQWFLLISGFVCGLTLLVSEKYLKADKKQISIIEPSQSKSIVYILFISGAIYACHGLFSRFELISLDLKFIPAILLMAYHVFRSLSQVKFRLAATTFFVIPLFLITRTFLPDSTKSARSLKNFYENDVKTYKRVDVGTTFGKFYNELQYNPHQGQCGTTYSTADYQHEFKMAGAGFSIISRDGNNITTKGINLYGGSDKEINLTTQKENSYFLFGVNPYIKYDLNWLGMGVGLHLGNLRWIPTKPIDEYTIDYGTKFSPVMPEASLRLGRRDILDLKYNFGFNFPTEFPLLVHELSFGTGFGYKTNFSLRYGAEFSNNVTHFFSAEGIISKQTGFAIKYSYGRADLYNSITSLTENKQLQRILFGINYRFGFSSVPAKPRVKIGTPPGKKEQPREY
ncbi:MAG: prolipoprotein diacylglyceryl transferase family protein [Bacteroidales bacterium]